MHREIGGAMSEHYPHARPRMSDFDVQVRVDVVAAKVIVGTQVNVEDLSKQRHFLRFRNAVTIKTNLAYAMLRCANVRPGDLVVDVSAARGASDDEDFHSRSRASSSEVSRVLPLAPSLDARSRSAAAAPSCWKVRTLPRTPVASYRPAAANPCPRPVTALDFYQKQITCVGMDVSRRSSEGARENARAEGFGDELCRFHCCDARNFRHKLEPESVGAIVTNLPW